MRPWPLPSLLLPGLIAMGCGPTSGTFDDDATLDDDASSDDDATGDDDTAGGFSLDTSAVGDAELLLPYSGQLGIEGTAVDPVTFVLSAGLAPPGLDLGADGLLSGAPSDFGTFSFTVEATDTVGETASADLVIDVSYDPSTVFLGAVAADAAYNNMCTPEDGDAVFKVLCHPWVRLAGTGITETVSRPLLPALFHHGADGLPDDLERGMGDDVLLHTFDPLSVTWSFEAREGGTAHNIDISPTDTSIDEGGVLNAGELTGPGTVHVESEEWGSGAVPAHVVAPDWCPEPGC